MDLVATLMRLLGGLLVLALLAGCQRTVEPIPPPALPAKMPLVRPATGDRDDSAVVVRANNAFAVALYHRMRTHPGNLLVSPACLSAGLAMVHTGAREHTARQIARVLQFPEGDSHHDGAYAALIRDLNADAGDGSFQIRLADAVWVQEGYPLLDSYRATLKDVFALEGTPVDFSGRPSEACRVINDWTTTRTGGKIIGMLRPGDLASRTRLIVTSALYFRASWSARFYRERTMQEGFQVSPGKTVKVPMMNDHAFAMVHRYFDGGAFQVLQLPCGSHGEFAMTVILPGKSSVLAELEATLTLGALDSWLSQLHAPEEIIIALPKFRVRAEVTLDSSLAELGMPLAFDARADFSGINGKSRDLYLSQVRHATYIDVNEEGIEAAAGMDAISPDSFGEQKVPVFHADHPFLFLIRDTRSGCIILLGRLANPVDQAFELAN